MSADQMSGYFETRLTHDPRREAVWKVIAGYVATWIGTSDAVLELGAGYADWINNVAARRRVALDLSDTVLAHAAEGVDASVGSCTDLSAFEQDEFDAVIASNLLEHLSREAIDVTLAEVLRVLRSGGRLVLIQPNFRLTSERYFDDYTHVTPISDVGIADWLRSSGFTVVHLEARFLPFSLKSRLAFGYRLMPLYLRLPYRPLAGQMLVVASKP